MNVYTGTHRYFCEIDLHARTMYVCILDGDGNKVFHKNIPCMSDRFLQAIEPFRQGLVVDVECIFCWYWPADLCEADHAITPNSHRLIGGGSGPWIFSISGRVVCRNYRRLLPLLRDAP